MDNLVTSYATHEVKPVVVQSPQKVRNTANVSDGYYSMYGYKTAREARKLGVNSIGRSGRRDMDYDRLTIVQQSRDFFKDNLIYSGIINTAVNYIVGKGHSLQVMIDNKPELAQLTESLWDDFWKYPETRKLLSGPEVERMIMREVLLCGDVGTIKVKPGNIQIIESELISGGLKKDGYDDGLLVNDDGTISSFSVTTYKNGYPARGGRTVAAQNMIYLANLNRPSDYRGMPPAQQAFPMIHRINDVCDAEAIAWQTLARFVLIIQQEGSQDYGNSVSITDPNEDPADTPITDRITDLNYALMVNGKPGEDIKGIDRNIPGKDFPQTIRTFLRLMGLPLGMPLELMFLDWTESNYSQSRAVLEHAKLVFETWQQMLQDKFLNVILDWKIRGWQADGILPKDMSYSTNWIGPAFPWLDPLKEAQANSEKMERSQTTLHKVAKENGFEYDDLMRMRESEVKQAIEAAKRIKTETQYEGELPFEIFAGLKVPNKNETKSEVKSESITESNNNGN